MQHPCSKCAKLLQQQAHVEKLLHMVCNRQQCTLHGSRSKSCLPRMVTLKRELPWRHIQLKAVGGEILLHADLPSRQIEKSREIECPILQPQHLAPVAQGVPRDDHERCDRCGQARHVLHKASFARSQDSPGNHHGPCYQTGVTRRQNHQALQAFFHEKFFDKCPGLCVLTVYHTSVCLCAKNS